MNYTKSHLNFFCLLFPNSKTAETMANKFPSPTNGTQEYVYDIFVLEKSLLNIFREWFDL